MVQGKAATSLLSDSTKFGGDDSIRVQHVTADNRLYGDEGDDWIRADNRGNHLLSGGVGNDRLIGGVLGANIISGGDGRDHIFGGQLARNVLIGGADRDKVRGGLLNNNLLIGGTTSHDDNDEALLAILREWRSGRAFHRRVDNLANGGGLNGDAVLVRDETVFGDEARDVLFGGLRRDWSFDFDLDVLRAFAQWDLIDDQK